MPVEDAEKIRTGKRLAFGWVSGEKRSERENSSNIGGWKIVAFRESGEIFQKGTEWDEESSERRAMQMLMLPAVHYVHVIDPREVARTVRR